MSEVSESLALITPRNSEVHIPKKPIRVIGIDLGTTNSTISEIVLQPGSSVLPDAEPIEICQETNQGTYYSTLVPSVVAITPNRTFVGEGAKMLRPEMDIRRLSPGRDLFWDCKNEIGTRRTYHRAPEGFRSAKEISACVLRFINEAAQENNPEPIETTVVTIPASFQTAQRTDTFEAANLASLNVPDSGGLLDEPTAAFIAYLVQKSQRLAEDLNTSRNLVVFDFGGGTCDVAVFRLVPPKKGKPIDIEPLSVSRYCHLGGSVIDQAIVIEILLPQLIEQNGLDRFQLDFDDKNNYVIPALLGAAELLKIKLCQEVVRQRGLARDAEDSETIQVTSPATYPCTLRSKIEYLLKNPTLNLKDFCRVLKPFFDEDVLYPVESEYLTTCSIYAPLNDAIERANLDVKDINYCLVVGGSSLIPQITDALERYFANADMLQFDTVEEMLTAVSKGAAFQALSIALYGQGIFRTVTGGKIAIRTASGPRTLIERGKELPYPQRGWKENHDLTVPETSLTKSLHLRVELCDGDNRTLFAERWEINHMVSEGDPLLLRYRMNANQVMEFELKLTNEPDSKFEGEIENPLSSVVNMNKKRDKVVELEEKIRTNPPKQEQQNIVLEIANLEIELGRRERALSLFKNLWGSNPDSHQLNRMGVICRAMGDHKSAERYYRQASKADRKKGSSLFNLALLKREQGKHDTAMHTVDEAIAIEEVPSYFVLKAILAEKLKKFGERDASLERAFKLYDPVALLNDWQLSWYMQAAKLAQDDVKVQEVEDERKRRSKRKNITPEAEGLLPEIHQSTNVVPRP